MGHSIFYFRLYLPVNINRQGLTALMALNILEFYDLSKMGDRFIINNKFDANNSKNYKNTTPPNISTM